MSDQLKTPHPSASSALPPLPPPLPQILDHASKHQETSISPPPPPSSIPSLENASPLNRSISSHSSSAVQIADHSISSMSHSIDPQYLAAGVHSPNGILAQRYQIEKLIGQGGMGKVYLASDIHLERKVVIKVAHFESAMEDQNFARFKREALKIASISHPNVVGIYDYGVQEGVQYLVMEWVSGQTIKEELKQFGPLKPERTFTIFTQLLLGLTVAHKIDMIHRDIKPSNLMWDPINHRLKILDFGLARGLSGDTLTETGHVHGSIQYMAPEQIKGEGQDQRTDLYAVGVLMYQLITGVLPYNGDNTVELMFHKLQKDAPDLKEHAVAHWVPPSLHQLISQCLSNEIDARPQNAENCLMLLKKGLKEWSTYSIDEINEFSLPHELVDLSSYLFNRSSHTEISDSELPNTTQWDKSWSQNPVKMGLVGFVSFLVGMAFWGWYQQGNQAQWAQSWLQQQTAVLSIHMDPNDPQSTLWIDDESFTPVPARMAIKPGPHHLKVKFKQKEWQKNVNIKGGEVLSFELMLSPPKVSPLSTNSKFNLKSSTGTDEDSTDNKGGTGNSKGKNKNKTKSKYKKQNKSIKNKRRRTKRTHTSSKSNKRTSKSTHTTQPSKSHEIKKQNKQPQDVTSTNDDIPVFEFD